jgi:hypothetical protein
MICGVTVAIPVKNWMAMNALSCFVVANPMLQIRQQDPDIT